MLFVTEPRSLCHSVGPARSDDVVLLVSWETGKTFRVKTWQLTGVDKVEKLGDKILIHTKYGITISDPIIHTDAEHRHLLIEDALEWN